MKKYFYLLSLLTLNFSCTIENDNSTKDTSTANKKEVDSSADEMFDETLDDRSDIETEDDFNDYEGNWNEFVSALINDVEFNWNEFVEIEGELGSDFEYLFQDEYTKEELSMSSYESLENTKYNGENVKLFVVVVSDGAGSTMGSKFYFQEKPKGLKLVGHESY